jgi:putative endonuclease
MNKKNHTTKGKHAENMARKWLSNQSWKSLYQNYYCRHGEIDLIMKKNNLIIFIEVKFRSNNNFGNALSAVTPSKIKKIKKTSLFFIFSHPHLVSFNFRYDIITFDKYIDDQHILWIKNAFLI